MTLLYYSFLFFGSSGITLASILLFQKLFYTFWYIDNPKKYKKNRKPVPYGMGIVFFVVFGIFSLMEWMFFSNFWNETIFTKHILLFIFGGIITTVSFFDDRVSLSPKIRLTIQIIIGMILGVTVVQVGYILPIFSYFLWENSFLQSPILPFLFTTFWYVFLFNAVNWSDGVPGNTSWLLLICFLVLFLLGVKLYISWDYKSEENTLYFLSITALMVGSLGVFFFFDRNEKILMGDSGTMFLGFLLASMAIIVGGKIWTVVCVFGVYIIDAVYVVMTRIFTGKNPLLWDSTHFHHRLLQAGMSEKNLRRTVFLSAFLFGCLSLFFTTTGKVILFILILLFVIFFPKYIQYFSKKSTWK